MKIEKEKSTKIQMMSFALFTAVFCLGSVPIRYISKTSCFTGPTEHFYITIYSLIPPNSYPTEKADNLPLAKSPLKDNIYAFIFALPFLFLGFYKLRMRWLYHFITAGSGLFVSIMLLLNFYSTVCFIHGILLLAAISVFDIILGIEMLINKDNKFCK